MIFLLTWHLRVALALESLVALTVERGVSVQDTVTSVFFFEGRGEVGLASPYVRAVWFVITALEIKICCQEDHFGLVNI